MSIGQAVLGWLVTNAALTGLLAFACLAAGFWRAHKKRIAWEQTVASEKTLHGPNVLPAPPTDAEIVERYLAEIR